MTVYSVFLQKTCIQRCLIVLSCSFFFVHEISHFEKIIEEYFYTLHFLFEYLFLFSILTTFQFFGLNEYVQNITINKIE
jgi:hypothetical protein